MKQKHVLALAAATTTLVIAGPACANTLRCGSVLIREGDTQGYVRDKCGEPDSQQTYTEPVRAVLPNGTSHEVGTTSKDVWRYKRSSGSFPAVLTFEQGVLRKLEFEK
jgi:hypothetical protein